ncbi:hypothetical protein BGZ60DRAFT_432991 [Tricladium varicosporioides]|nr:hypothetical protein BGZ60DRAFT_432991 [Hymenoscyphus varicosporioides]
MASSKTKSQDTLQNTAKKSRARAPPSLTKAKNNSISRNNRADRALSATSPSPASSFLGNGVQLQSPRWKSPLNFSSPNPIFVTILISSGLSSETPISPPQQTFVIHLAAIYMYSSTLSRIFTSPNLDSSSTLTHTITNIAAGTFGLFVNWLYFQTFEHTDKRQPSVKEFARLWILGQEYGVPKLQNQAITILEQITRQLAAYEGMRKLRGVFDLAYSPDFGSYNVGMTQLKQLAVDTVLDFSKNVLDLQGLPEGMKSDITAVLMTHFQGLPSEQRGPTRKSGGYLVDESKPVEVEDEGFEDCEAQANSNNVEVKNEENFKDKEGVHGTREEIATALSGKNEFLGSSSTSGVCMELEFNIEGLNKGEDGSETSSWKTAKDGEDRAKGRNGGKRELRDSFEKILEENLENNRKEDQDEWDAMSVDRKEIAKRVYQTNENGARLCTE